MGRHSGAPKANPESIIPAKQNLRGCEDILKAVIMDSGLGAFRQSGMTNENLRVVSGDVAELREERIVEGSVRLERHREGAAHVAHGDQQEFQFVVGEAKGFRHRKSAANAPIQESALKAAMRRGSAVAR